MGSANEKGRYYVPPSLIGIAHTQHDPCCSFLSPIIRWGHNIFWHPFSQYRTEFPWKIKPCADYLSPYLHRFIFSNIVAALIFMDAYQNHIPSDNWNNPNSHLRLPYDVIDNSICWSNETVSLQTTNYMWFGYQGGHDNNNLGKFAQHIHDITCTGLTQLIWGWYG